MKLPSRLIARSLSLGLAVLAAYLPVAVGMGWRENTQPQPTGPGYSTTPAAPSGPGSAAPVRANEYPPSVVGPRPPHPGLVVPDNVIFPPSRVRPWREQSVVLQAVNVSVAIDEQVATTSLELVLFNPSRSPQEAQVVLPVPDGVTVRSFQYDGTGPEPTAVLLPKDEARRIYDSIVNRARDPGLLEFVGYNVIKSSVFPVPGNSKQSVRLVYEQVLPADVGRVDYSFPRSESLAVTGVAWTISATIKSTRPIATVYSASHEVAIDRTGSGSVAVRVPERASRTPGSFRLSYVSGGGGGGAGRDDGIAATLLAYPDPSVNNGQGGYFLLLGGVPTVPPGANPVKREVTLVIDRSGSMRGQKIVQAKAAAQQVIDGLQMGEAFNIVDFSDSIGTFSPAPVVKSEESAAKARAYIAAIDANGGTALHDALMEALRPKPMEGMLPMVIFLTDGLPTIGERNEATIREHAKSGNTHNRRVFTFGVGFDVNTPLLTAVARGSRGAPTFVQPEENVEVAVSQVFRRLTGPVMGSPRLVAVGADGKPATGGAIREVMPGLLPDYFDGDQVIVLGQYATAGALRLRLEGEYLGKANSSFEFAFDLDRSATTSARHGFVPRLWATRKIAALIEEIRQSGAVGTAGQSDPRVKELVDEVVRLSTKYGILTEYTSFLATDADGRAVDPAWQGRGGGGGGVSPFRGEAAPAAAQKDVTDKLAVRSGKGAMNQEENTRQLSQSMVQSKSNMYVNAEMKQVELTGVQMVDQHALYQRAGNRWVDARLLKDEDKEPERTIGFGTPEYAAAVDTLAKENMLWVLTNSGDLYLLLDGKRTLIKAP